MLPQVLQHSRQHFQTCHQCHGRHLYHRHNCHRQGVPVHQAGGSELRGGEEGQPVLSNHILPPRSVNNSKLKTRDLILETHRILSYGYKYP